MEWIGNECFKGKLIQAPLHFEQLGVVDGREGIESSISGAAIFRVAILTTFGGGDLAHDGWTSPIFAAFAH